jgi:hypothetical protein
MSRVIQVDVLLGMIDQAQVSFAIEALSHKPAPGAADYNFGVITGMKSVRQNILNKIKEEDERTSKVESAGRSRAY